jgi:excisionase family DNA binding protein
MLSNMGKLITIQEAAEFLGVSPQTLRRWEREGRGVPFQKTAGANVDTTLQNYIPKTCYQKKNSLH